MEILDQNIQDPVSTPNFDPKQPPKYWLGHSFRNYANFTGRASRIEFWTFNLFYLLFAWAALAIDMMLGISLGDLGFGPVYLLVVLGMFIPTLAVGVRRMHDVGKHGAMILINLIPLVGPIWYLVLVLQRGDQTANNYGQDPLAEVHQEGYRPGFADNMILWVVLWTVANGLYWNLFTWLSNSDMWDIPLMDTMQLLGTYGWALVTLSLAAVIPDKTKRTFLVVLAGIIALWRMASTFYDMLQNI